MTFELNNDLLVESRLPKKFWRMSELTFPGEEELLRAVVRYTQQNPVCGNVLFYGPPKSGKTFLLSCALRRCLLRSLNCSYFRMQEISDIYYSEHNTARVNALQTPQMLALDNLDAPNKGERMNLLRLLRFREDERLPTLLATEFSPPEVENNFGPEIKRHLDAHFLCVKTSVDKWKLEALLSSEQEKNREEMFPTLKVKGDL